MDVLKEVIEENERIKWYPIQIICDYCSLAMECTVVLGKGSLK